MQADAKAVTFSQEAATLTAPADAANDLPATSAQTEPQTTDLAASEPDPELGVANPTPDQSAAPTLEQRARQVATTRINSTVAGVGINNPVKMLGKVKHLIGEMESNLLTDDLTPEETAELTLALQYIKESSSQLELALRARSKSRRRLYCCLLSCPIILAIPAAVGAASGAIGFPVMMGARNWTTSGITHINFVESMTAGSLVMVIPSWLFIGAVDKILQYPLGDWFLVAVNGALSGLIGAGMLSLLPSAAPDKGMENISFVVAAGIVGNLILFAAFYSALALLVCAIHPRTRNLCPTKYDACLNRLGLSFRYKSNTSSSQNVVELPAQAPTETAAPAAQTIEPTAPTPPVAPVQASESKLVLV